MALSREEIQNKIADILLSYFADDDREYCLSAADDVLCRIEEDAEELYYGD